MKLDNFKLEEYNETNFEHKTTIIEISNDAYGRTFLGDLELHIMCVNKRKEESLLNYAFIAYYNDKPVGFISITENGNYEITYGIRPKYRGEYMGALLLQEFSEKIFEQFKDVNELKLFINNLNTASRKTALIAGYEKKNGITYSQRRM